MWVPPSDTGNSVARQVTLALGVQLGIRQMGLRWIFVFAFYLVVSPSAFAGESSGVLHRVSCSVVRFYVAKYSAPAAEQWARSKGATEADIEAARRCLAAETTRTAKAPTRPVALGSYGW